MCFLVAFSASAVQGTATKRRTQLLNLNPTARLIKRKIRRYGQAVRQRSATPLSPVRFRVAPPKRKALRKKCFSFWNDVFRLRGTRCALRAWCLLRKWCALRAWGCGTHHITLRRRSKTSLCVSTTSLWRSHNITQNFSPHVLKNTENCAIMKSGRRWRYAHKKTRLYNGHWY